MRTKGREILNIDPTQVINLLNKAFSDEWLAYYQYWIGAKVVKGPMKESIIAELNQHATDELRHADLLVNRIIQLGGEPVLSPEDWYKLTNCGYDSPSNPYVEKLLEQNIKGEQCAITVYHELMEMTKDKDPVTYQLAFEIMRDEVEHEEDLQGLQEDIDMLKKQFR